MPTLRTGRLLVGTVLATALTTSGAAAQSPQIPERLTRYSAQKYTAEQVQAMLPTTPNPWLSYRATKGGVDWNYWRAKRRAMTAARASRNPEARVRMIRRRGEPVTLITRFGTRRFQDDSVEITGNFRPPKPATLTADPEDEGSIPLATDTGVTSGNAVTIRAFIGDGPYGSNGTGSGDLDFYAIRNVRAGQTISIDLDTPVPFGPLDPYVELYDAQGNFIAANADGDASSFDSFLLLKAPADGDYFLSVAGTGTFILADKFDSSSGLGNIFGLPLDEGDYTVTIGLDYFDQQDFVFFLRKGDVIGASINGTAGTLSLMDRTGTERQGSSQDLSFTIPDQAPLPSGLASIGHIVDTPGRFRLRIRGAAAGAFTLQLVAALPPLRTGSRHDVQKIFLDFDGATLDLGSLFGRPPFMVTLSPLSAFLSNWGLTAADENAVIDSVVRVVEDSLVHEIERMGLNRHFNIEILNSRDHPDPFGQPNVSRVIIGGTVDELTTVTIGLAQSVDVGNFDTEETAFVLLDMLSSTDPTATASLNNVPRSAQSTIIDVIGVGVGEIASHEAGHLLGNWHTDDTNATANIMDAAGNLGFSILGLGPDGIFGTADDENVSFARDVFTLVEGFTGVEDSLNTVAFGATTRRVPFFY